MRLLSVALLTAGLLFVLASVASPPASAQCTPNPSLEFRLIALAPSGGQGEFYFVTLDQQPALADSGEVAFSATASIDFVQRQGVFRGAGGAPIAIATGDAFPPQLGSPDIDAEGRVAYRRGGSYIVVDGAGTAKTVIQVGDMFGGYRFDGAGDPRMNSSGTLALRAYLGISPADTQGNPAVMRVPLAGPAGAAVAAFTGNGGLFASIIGDAPVLDDLGQLAYLAVPIATGQTTIFAGSGGPVASTAGFAALGQPAVSDDGAIVYVALPLTGGRELRTDSGALGFSCNASSGFDVPAINDAGTVAVMGVPNSNDVPGACQSNPPETGPDGIYLFAPPYGAPTRIVALGDCLFGRTVVALNFSSKGLDALDEVAFWVSLSDSSTAIVRAGPPRPNTPPVLAPIGARSVAEGSRLAFTASASDADGDPLTFSMTGGPAGASMTAAGAFTWTPTELQGPGDYSATIVVDDGANRGSDSETIALHVSEVNVPPEVDFALAEYVISVGGSAHLTDLTSDVDRPANALARTVDWGDGGAPEALVTAEASHLYPAHGAYLIALEVDDGQASVTRTHTLTVNAPPVAGFTLDPGTTVPRTHVLTLWSEASDPDGDIAYESVDWGDGSQVEYFIGSIEHAYSAHGDYTVTQTVVDHVDASDVARRVVHVVSDELGPPTAAFAVSGTPLTNETVRVLDQSLGALPDDALDDLVDWGDGTTSAVVPGDVATHVYDTPDLYTIVLTATDPRGQSATDHVALSVASHRPVAELGGPAVALIGQVVAFQDASHDVDGTADLSSVIFDWGDGSTSSVAPAGVAEHAWAAAGDFSVTLSASDRWGERDSATQVIHVSSAPPTVDFTLRGYRVEGEPLTLEDRSHDGQGLSAVDVTWGDGAESSIAPHGSAVHVYESTGVYTVRLTATNTRGERATSSTDLTIVNRPPPVAQLALSGSFFFGETLRLVDQSQPGLPGDVLSALVDWGDGSTSPVGEDTSATHVYAAPGAYTVALTVTDQTGRRSIDYFAVTIRSHPPIAEMSTHALALVGEQVTLADLSSDADGQGDIATRVLAWGDGATSEVAALATASHAYASPGDFQVTLTVTDRWGERDAVSQTIHVSSSPPIAELALGGVRYLHGAVTAQDLSTDPGGISAVTVTWGDGASDALPPRGVASHVYAAAGGYVVTLTAVNTRGERASVGSGVTIFLRPPRAAMSLPSEVYAGQAFTLTEHSTDPDGRANIQMVLVDWGDRSSVGIGNPSPTSPTSTYGHAYARPGRYVVRMTVVDGDGGIDVAEAVVTVVDRAPIAAFRLAPQGAALGEVVSLHDLSVDPDGADDLARIVVDWGDGTARQVIAPGGDARHRYHAVGTFAVTVTAIDRATYAGLATQRIAIAGGVPAAHLASIAVANPFVTALRPGQRLTAVATNDGAVPVSATVTWRIGVGPGATTLVSPARTLRSGESAEGFAVSFTPARGVYSVQVTATLSYVGPDHVVRSDDPMSAFFFVSRP